MTVSDNPHIEGMERFIRVQEDGVAFDEKGMYEYALSLGLKPEQRLDALYVVGTRPSLGEVFQYLEGVDFSVGELQTETVFIPFNLSEHKVMDLIFRVL